MKSKINLYFYILLAFYAIGGFLVVSRMLPTGDDIGYITTPDPAFGSETFLPWGSWWRPFDALVGLLVRNHPSWFPMLNHVLVWSMHLLSGLLLYQLLKQQFRLSMSASRLGLAFYLLSPAMLGTVFDTDAVNQSGAQLFCLLGFTVYVGGKSKGRILLWLLLTFISTLFKENGITWFVITPVLASVWQEDKRCGWWKNTLLGLITAVLYGVLRLSLPHIGVLVGDDYVSLTITVIIKALYKVFSFALLPIDNVALIHDGNKALTVLSILLTWPFLLFLLWQNRRKLASKRVVVTIFCLFIAILPSLTLFSPMHNYGLLPFTTLLVAYFWNNIQPGRLVVLLLCLFFIGIVGIDAHHAYERYLSGQRARKLGLESVRLIENNTPKGQLPDSIYSISVRGNYRSYATFSICNADAFHWGCLSKYANGYRWPRTWADTAIDISSVNKEKLDSIASSAYKHGFRLVLTVDDDGVRVIKFQMSVPR